MATGDYPEVFQHVIFLASLLAGFAVAIVVELISKGNRSRIRTAAIIAYLLSSSLLLVTTVGVTFSGIALAGTPEAIPPSESVLKLGMEISPLLLFGIVVFLVGIGLTGWLYTKVVGVVSSVIAALSTVGIIAIWLRLFFSG